MAASWMRKEKEWTFEETQSLIQEYKKYPCLYNSKMKDYKDREKKRAALEEIAAVFGAEADDVVKKFQRLRIQYNRELSRIAAPTEDGLPAKVTWVHFKPLEFLKDFCSPKFHVMHRNPSVPQSMEEVELEDASRNQSDEDVKFDITESQNNLVIGEVVSLKDQPKYRGPPRRSIQPIRRKRIKLQKNQDDKHDLVQKALTAIANTAIANTTSSPVKNGLCTDDIFGQYIASELKGIQDECLKKLIKHRIQTVLFETQLPSLSVIDQPHDDFKSYTNSMESVGQSNGHFRPFSLDQTPQRNFTVRPTSAPPPEMQDSLHSPI